MPKKVILNEITEVCDGSGQKVGYLVPAVDYEGILSTERDLKQQMNQLRTENQELEGLAEGHRKCLCAALKRDIGDDDVSRLVAELQSFNEGDYVPLELVLEQLEQAAKE